MQSIVQGISPVWSKNMARIKSRHYFEIGELVIPHPIIHYAYKDVDKMEFGIVIKRIPPKHPTNDYRKVRVFWQNHMKEETYYAHQVFHLHHEDEVGTLYECWESKPGAMSLFDTKLPFSYNQTRYAQQNLSDLINSKFPLLNPCKGLTE